MRAASVGRGQAGQDRGGGPPPVTIPTNSVTPYLRTRIELTDVALRATGPRTLLGIVPVGRRELEVALADLLDVRVTMTLRWERLLLAVALLAGAVLASGVLRLLPLALALWLLPLSYVAALRIESRQARHDVPICLFYRFDVGLVAIAARLAAREQRELPRRGSGPGEATP
jgi:hypothetical protein